MFASTKYNNFLAIYELQVHNEIPWYFSKPHILSTLEDVRLISKTYKYSQNQCIKPLQSQTSTQGLGN